MAHTTESAFRDEQARFDPRPPGERYDVGGYRLHLQRRGKGRPAAVLDSGLGGSSPLWANTLAALAPVTEACAFDRAGSGWSDSAPAGLRRTSRQIVEELRVLLGCAGLEPPYVLLGHSFGGINVLAYAHAYPAEVAGLVLVDPSHPEMLERLPGVPSGKTMMRIFGFLGSLGRLGLLRWVGPGALRQLMPNGAGTLPPEAWQALVFFSRHAKQYQAASQEAAVSVESFAQARGTPSCLGAIPLIVLTAEWWVTGKSSALKRAMVSLREELAAYSTRGRQEIVGGCDHTNLPVVRADAVAEAVRDVLQAGAPA